MAITYSFPVPKQGANLRELIATITNLFGGATNAKLDKTLTANAATTTIIDPRLTPETHLTHMALTANAALIQGSLWYDAQGIGTIRVNHTNSATADKTFRFEIRR